MSLCYDFQKWTMITFASVAISLTVGLLLINFAHGQEVNRTNLEIAKMKVEDLKKKIQIEQLYREELSKAINTQCYMSTNDQSMSTSELENRFTQCYLNGAIK